MKRDLVDPELFGNEAGEDEDLDVLGSYFLEKSDFERFYSPKQRIAFVRSRKGVGKSALLKHTLLRRRQAQAGELLLYVKASDLVAMQDIKADSAIDLIYGWQQRLCSRINLELGSVLKLAFSDDTITLVESAELAGFRDRNLVSTLMDRFRLRGTPIDVERTRISQSDSAALLKRVTEKQEINVWLFVDDIDATFINNDHERLRTSTFFSSCRNLVNSVHGLNIRASVRTDIWTILAQYDESLDKCEQYMLDLQWSTAESGKILEKKILSYFQRSYPSQRQYTALRPGKHRRDIYALVFREPFLWAGRSLEAFRPIHILSAGRPRWAAQLCKLSGKDAASKNHSHISMGNVRFVLGEYGQARLSDLYKEHRHQCPSMQEIIETFSGGHARYSTDQLFDHLTENVIRRAGLPHIDGIPALKGSLTLAHFLFRIGFVAAREETAERGLGFIRYEDRPDLLTSTANLDDGLNWEIHPSYRQVLRITS